MKVQLIEYQGILIAEFHENQILINNEQDAVELLMNCKYQGADSILLNRAQLNPDFYDLKTRFAGDILQKFSTYDSRLVIIGEWSHLNGKSIQDFIRESNRTGRILFVKTREEGLERLGH